MGGQDHDSAEDDRVWELLKNASEAPVDPFFSRNVVREVRSIRSAEDFAHQPVGFIASIRQLFSTRPVYLAAGLSILVGAIVGLHILAPAPEASFAGSDEILEAGDLDLLLGDEDAVAIAEMDATIASVDAFAALVERDDLSDLEDEEMLTLLFF